METPSFVAKNCTVCKSDIASGNEGVNCPECHTDWHGKCQPKENKCPACGVAVKPFMSPLFSLLMALFAILTTIRFVAGVVKDVGSFSEFLLVIVSVIAVIAIACGISVMFAKLFGKKPETK